MRVTACLAAVFWALLGLIVAAAEDQGKPVQGQRLQVKVRTVDGRGRPIAGALIETWQEGEGESWQVARRRPVNDGKEVRTGADGWASLAFVLPAAPPDRRGPRPAFCLTAQARGFLTGRRGRIGPAARDRFEIVFTLRRLVSVEGQVIDRQGRPVAGATVFHTGNAVRRGETKTDREGRFRLGGLTEGTPPIFVAHPGYHFHGQLVDAPAEGGGGAPAIRLLALGETPPPLRTLPPLRSREEEMGTARRVLRPVWQSAVRTGDEGDREWLSEEYARIEPWAAYDYVNATLSKQSKSRFVSRQMPQLYAGDPDEALAVLESLDALEFIKMFGLLNAVRQTPDLSRRQKLDLLDRAVQHGRAATEPDERVRLLSIAAVRLFDLGKTEEARTIVAALTPTANRLSPKYNAALTSAGTAIGLFDLPAGLRLIRGTRTEGEDYYGYYWMPALSSVACRIAGRRPGEAEQIVAEAIDFERRATAGWSPEGAALQATLRENRLTIPLCYGLALADAVRAERLAATIRTRIRGPTRWE